MFFLVENWFLQTSAKNFFFGWGFVSLSVVVYATFSRLLVSLKSCALTLLSRTHISGFWILPIQSWLLIPSRVLSPQSVKDPGSY